MSLRRNLIKCDKCGYEWFTCGNPKYCASVICSHKLKKELKNDVKKM